MARPVSLPRTYRPFGARVATTVAGFALLAATVVLWRLFTDDIRASFTVGYRLTVIFMLGLVFSGLYGIYRMAVRADATGLTVVNGYRTHRFEWAELVRISMTTHRPWALLDLADGSAVSVMAIQTADGDRAVRAVRELAVLLAEQTRTDHDS